MTHYFIDTENVGKRMSDLTDSLQTGDIIHMFYTDLNAGMNVTMRMLGTITQAGAFSLKRFTASVGRPTPWTFNSSVSSAAC